MPVEEKVGTDLEILRELDFTPSTPCQWNMTKQARAAHLPLCDEAAQWAFVCRNCADTKLICHAHHDRVVSVAYMLIQCEACGTAGRVFDLLHVVPWGRS